ncbi:MAG: SulP family inorganic anion transporter [Chloroflexota bacterium]
MNLFTEYLQLLRREFSHYDLATLQKDFLASLTVAAVALPLALAFGVASGADAAAGLVTAILSGIVIGLLGGAPYQISGPTGAMSAVLIVLATRYGLQGVWITGVIAGLILIVLGVLRLGKVVSLIPAPVISGFTSGIAIIIAFGQIDSALGIKTPAAENVIEKLACYAEAGLAPNPNAILVTLLVMVVMVVWPRFKSTQRIPGSLAGIVIATLAVALFHWDIPTIGAVPRNILLDHRLHFTDINGQTLGQLFVPAMSIAALGAIESLLCGAVAGNMTGIRLHNSVELVAQGLGNVLVPFLGGVPATAAIARTSVNIKSGGVTRLSSVLHGVTLLLAALLFAPLIGRVPLAALAGVLLITAWRMNEWHAIRFYFGKKLKHAIAAFLITLVCTVLLDLTQAIVIGFGISTLIFMAQMSDLRVVHQAVDVERLNANGHKFIHPEHAIQVYYLSGPLFFAAARKLTEEVEASDAADASLIFSLRGVPLIDATGIEVLREIWQRQRKGGGNLLLAGLQPRVESLMGRSGLLDELGRERIHWSADRAILSLGISLPEGTGEIQEIEDMAQTLVVVSHEERAGRRI